MNLAQMQHAINWWDSGHGHCNVDLLTAVLKEKDRIAKGEAKAAPRIKSNVFVHLIRSFKHKVRFL